MPLRIRQSFKILAPGSSLRRRVAYSLLVVRLQRFEAAASMLGEPGQAPTDRIRAVVKTYEKDLNELLTQARSRSRAELVDELRNRVDSFDIQISRTVQEQDPELRQAMVDLDNSSQEEAG